MRALLLLSLILMPFSTTALTLSEALTPFKAKYTAQYNGRTLKGSRELSINNGQWQLRSEFKTLFAAIRESSQGEINDSLALSVHRYDYQRKIFGVKKRQNRIFDNENHTVSFNDGKNMGSYTIPADTFDTASQQLYIREMLMRGETEFTMPIASRNRLKSSQFKASTATTLKLPIGTINVIRVDKVDIKNSGRKTVMWFSPDYNYQLVKLSQTEKDGKSYDMQITQIQ